MEKRPEDTLSDIRRLMERSSRFQSLSGLSFVAAGICGLGGIWRINHLLRYEQLSNAGGEMTSQKIISALIWVSAITLIAAMVLGFTFTFVKIKRKKLSAMDATFRRACIHFAIPMVTGGIFIAGMLVYHQYQFIATSCLLFYGIAMTSASHYTVKEIRYLGIMEIVTGIICLFSHYDLLILALGFGIINILLGLIIWNKYR